MLTALRDGGGSDLSASQQRMRQLGIGGAVVEAMDRELALALDSLAPHEPLPAVALLKQLADLLKFQVARLPAPSPVSR